MYVHLYCTTYLSPVYSSLKLKVFWLLQEKGFCNESQSKPKLHLTRSLDVYVKQEKESKQKWWYCLLRENSNNSKSSAVQALAGTGIKFPPLEVLKNKNVFAFRGSKRIVFLVAFICKGCRNSLEKIYSRQELHSKKYFGLLCNL